MQPSPGERKPWCVTSQGFRCRQVAARHTQREPAVPHRLVLGNGAKAHPQLLVNLGCIDSHSRHPQEARSSRDAGVPPRPAGQRPSFRTIYGLPKSDAGPIVPSTGEEWGEISSIDDSTSPATSVEPVGAPLPDLSSMLQTAPPGVPAWFTHAASSQPAIPTGSRISRVMLRPLSSAPRSAAVGPHKGLPSAPAASSNAAGQQQAAASAAPAEAAAIGASASVPALPTEMERHAEAPVSAVSSQGEAVFEAGSVGSAGSPSPSASASPDEAPPHVQLGDGESSEASLPSTASSAPQDTDGSVGSAAVDGVPGTSLDQATLVHDSPSLPSAESSDELPQARSPYSEDDALEAAEAFPADPDTSHRLVEAWAATVPHHPPPTMDSPSGARQLRLDPGPTVPAADQALAPLEVGVDIEQLLRMRAQQRGAGQSTMLHPRTPPPTHALRAATPPRVAEDSDSDVELPASPSPAEGLSALAAASLFAKDVQRTSPPGLRGDESAQPTPPATTLPSKASEVLPSGQTLTQSSTGLDLPRLARRRKRKANKPANPPRQAVPPVAMTARTRQARADAARSVSTGRRQQPLQSRPANPGRDGPGEPPVSHPGSRPRSASARRGVSRAMAGAFYERSMAWRRGVDAAVSQKARVQEAAEVEECSFEPQILPMPLPSEPSHPRHRYRKSAGRSQQRPASATRNTPSASQTRCIDATVAARSIPAVRSARGLSAPRSSRRPRVLRRHEPEPDLNVSTASSRASRRGPGQPQRSRRSLKVLDATQKGAAVAGQRLEESIKHARQCLQGNRPVVAPLVAPLSRARVRRLSHALSPKAGSATDKPLWV